MKSHPFAHILLVDDDPAHVELTRFAFEELRLPHVIHVALGGQQATDYLLGNGGFADRQAHPLPELVLLDLKMPVVDGHEVLRRTRPHPVLKGIPIVVLSSSMESRDVACTYAGGANSYLAKPVSFGRLVDTVRRIHEYWLTLNVALH